MPNPESRMPQHSERWPSGLRRRPAKAFGPEGSRGFESLPLRTNYWRDRRPPTVRDGWPSG